jgi:hypothetical protein
MTREDLGSVGASVDPLPAVLDPDRLVEGTDDQLDEIFRGATTLPVDRLMNVGEHRVDLGAGSIYNDAHWKGWLPKGLVVRDIFSRLSTGYAKRFWRQRGQFLGETQYVEGRILVKHTLEDLTIDRPVNDLQPGQYFLLRYTDPVFEHVFYDVMRALTDGIIVYRGYSGRFPDGKRGFTGLLMRRYGYGQMGVADHVLLSGMGSAPTSGALEGTWKIDAIATSNHATPIGTLSCSASGGDVTAECRAVENPSILVPEFVLDHFNGNASAFLPELRSIDDQTMVGKWTTDIKGVYARLLLGGSRGLFHAERGKGVGRKFSMYYVLTRTV